VQSSSCSRSVLVVVSVVVGLSVVDVDVLVVVGDSVLVDAAVVVDVLVVDFSVFVASFVVVADVLVINNFSVVDFSVVEASFAVVVGFSVEDCALSIGATVGSSPMAHPSPALWQHHTFFETSQSDARS